MSNVGADLHGTFADFLAVLLAAVAKELTN
jgi:hypothetical protein